MSSRFPRKILENVTEDLKSIDILIARSLKVCEKVIVATTDNNSDDELVNYVIEKYPSINFRGSEQNKLKRWYHCLKKHAVDIACFIDGDDLALTSSSIEMV